MLNKESLSSVSELRPSTWYVRSAPPARPPAVAAPSPSPTPADETGRAPSALTAEAVQNALDRMSSHVQNLQRALQFSVDEESGDTVVKVIDAETKEVIRQIPSEELLAIAHRLRSTAGVLVAESV